MIFKRRLTPQQREEKIKALEEEKRIECICRTQEELEAKEIVQNWNIVFGNIKPKKKKEIHVVERVSLRNIWLEELFIFQQIKTFKADVIFHDISKYSLQWKPPNSTYTLIVPLDDAVVQERTILNLNKLTSFARDRVIFYFVPLDPSMGMFAPPVHPSSLLSFRTKVSVLRQLCEFYKQSRISLEEFNKIMTCNYDVWCLTLFNLLSEEEQQFHGYLTKVSPKVVDQQNIESKYYHDTITLQEYEDLKFPERKKKKDEEAMKYPLPYNYSTCIICHQEGVGLIRCQNCGSVACVNCIKTQFLDPETKEGCFLLMHRKFCLRLGKLPECVPEIVQEPAYLRELRDTGRLKAVELLVPNENNVDIIDLDGGDVEEEEEEVETEEERAEREEREKYARECPPELQELQVHVDVLQKKKDKVRKDVLKFQSNIDDPGHSDMYVQRNERLKLESLQKFVKIDRELAKLHARVSDMGLVGSYAAKTLEDIRRQRQDIENMGSMESVEAYMQQYNVLMEIGDAPGLKVSVNSEDEYEAVASPTAYGFAGASAETKG